MVWGDGGSVSQLCMVLVASCLCTCGCWLSEPLLVHRTPFPLSLLSPCCTYHPSSLTNTSPEHFVFLLCTRDSWYYEVLCPARASLTPQGKNRFTMKALSKSLLQNSCPLLSAASYAQGEWKDRGLAAGWGYSLPCDTWCSFNGWQ